MNMCHAHLGQHANFASMRALAARPASWHRGTTIATATYVGTEFKPYAQRPKEILH